MLSRPIQDLRLWSRWPIPRMLIQGPIIRRPIVGVYLHGPNLPTSSSWTVAGHCGHAPWICCRLNFPGRGGRGTYGRIPNGWIWSGASVGARHDSRASLLGLGQAFLPLREKRTYTMGATHSARPRRCTRGQIDTGVKTRECPWDWGQPLACGQIALPARPAMLCVIVTGRVQ